MTDKQILDEVYKLVTQPYKVDQKTVRNFIEQEWQKADDEEQLNMYNRNRPVEEHLLDVKEIERHRGLVIGPDGTVEDLK